MWRPDRSAVIAAAAAITLLIPFVGSWIGRWDRPAPVLEAPLDPSLRVPIGAAFLSSVGADLRPGDLVVGVSRGDGSGWVEPADRRSLRRELEGVPPGGRVSLRVRRAESVLTTLAPVSSDDSWRLVAREWPITLLAATFLLFSLAIVTGSRHPVAFPLFNATFWPAVALLSLLDLVLPPEPNFAAWLEPRARLGSLAVCLIPASFMHLSMRFPVVAARSRVRSFALLPYGFWLALAGLSQLRLHEAGTARLIEGFAVAITMAAAGILLVTSLLGARSMTPIEQARTRALAAGIGLGAIGPLVFVARGADSRGLEGLLLLGALSFPVALGWAIVRYHLLDPPSWLRELLFSGISALAAIVLALAVASAGVGMGEPTAAGAGRSESVGLALGTVVLFHTFRSLIERGARRGALRSHGLEGVLDEAVRRLARSGSPEAVLATACFLIQRRLGATAVEALPLPPDSARPGSRLRDSGLELWRAFGGSGRRVVTAHARHEDPDAEQAEVVLVLEPQSGPPALIIISSRSDALPYAEEDLRLLDGLALTAATALGSAANTAELERRVKEKTAWIESSLRDRARVLETARAICEAHCPSVVRERVEAFLQPWARSISWSERPPRPAGGTVVARVGEHQAKSRYLVATGLDPARSMEIAPLVETVCIFAGLALDRLDLLAELKQEVESQARELALVRSRRLHAEFVRGTAHELRKPTEEVYALGSFLAEELPSPLREKAISIRRAASEMSRRLGLLLFHSGLRFDRRCLDLTRILADAVCTATTLHPDRMWSFSHEAPRIPLLGDPSRLLSVAENLLDNAVKATRPGDRIGIRAWCESGDLEGREAGWACFEIEDEGSGIEAAHLEEIFEPGVSFSTGGFGLGLALCREIAHGHGGMIEAESGDGVTIVRVRLPQFGENHPAEGSS